MQTDMVEAFVQLISRVALPRVVDPANGGGLRGPRGLRTVNIPGINLSVGASLETVWSPGGLAIYPSSALTMTLESQVADDGKLIEIAYLDGNLLPQALAQLTTNSASPPTLDNVFRILRMTGLTGVEATAPITLENAGNVYMEIPAGDCISQGAMFTVPSVLIGSLMEYNVTIERNEQVSYYAVARPTGTDCWRRLRWLPKMTQGSWDFRMSHIPYLHSGFALDPGTDVEIRALTSIGGTQETSCQMQMSFTDPREHGF